MSRTSRASEPLRVGIRLAPQATTVDDLRRLWRAVDEAGFDSCWNFDHFAAVGRDAPYGDVFESWTLLAAMAEVTEQVRIGCMVTGSTYRHPAVLAKMAVTVDHLSLGRLDFGLGAAWAEAEHTMLGLEFGTVAERMDRLEEACQVMKSLWTEPTTTFAGRHFQLIDAISNPKPIQRPHPPLWIGGSGRRRTLRIAALYADAWNVVAGTPEEVAELSGVLDRHCADVGRDPAVIRRSVLIRHVPARDDPDDLLHNAEGYATAGIGEAIVVLGADDGLSGVENVAQLLPRLRSIG